MGFFERGARGVFFFFWGGGLERVFLRLVFSSRVFWD